MSAYRCSVCLGVVTDRDARRCRQCGQRFDRRRGPSSLASVVGVRLATLSAPPRAEGSRRDRERRRGRARFARSSPAGTERPAAGPSDPAPLQLAPEERSPVGEPVLQAEATRPEQPSVIAEVPRSQPSRPPSPDAAAPHATAEAASPIGMEPARAAALEEGGPAGTNLAPPAMRSAPAPALPVARRDPVAASHSRSDGPPPQARVAPLDDVGTASRAPQPLAPPDPAGEAGSRLERARKARDRIASRPPLRRRRAEIETARPDDPTAPS